MPAFNSVNIFREHLAKGVHNFASHTFKVALTNVAPTASVTTLADITQIAAAGGYVAGGYTLDNFAVNRTGAIVNITVSDEEIIATGGALPTFRYLVIYNDTASGDPVVGWIDQGEARTFQTGEKFRIRFNATIGIITIS